MDESNQGQQAQQNQQQGQSAPQQAPVPQVTAAPHNRTLMGILSYLGILVVIPLMMAKDDSFVKFHAKQGLVLAIIGVATWFVGMYMWSLWAILNLVNLAVIILSIIGIVNVVNGKENEIPVVGSLAKHFTF